MKGGLHKTLMRTWEIYTPVEERKFGYYVLPILYGDCFVGRIEVFADRKTKILQLKNIWFEKDIKQTKKLLAAIEKCAKKFAAFNKCDFRNFAE